MQNKILLFLFYTNKTQLAIAMVYFLRCVNNYEIQYGSFAPTNHFMNTDGHNLRMEGKILKQNMHYSLAKIFVNKTYFYKFCCTIIVSNNDAERS